MQGLELGAPARGILLLLALVLLLTSRNLTMLAAIYGVALLPLVVYRRVVGRHIRFLSYVLLPISLALFVVWGWIVQAGPGQPPGSSANSGLQFAALVSLRLALLAGLFQILITELSGRKLINSLEGWGIKGDSLVVIVAAISMVPEGRLRTSQVITARYSRGLVRRRTWLSGLGQIPYVLRPIFSWILRSAIDRGEMWQHRRLITRTGPSSNDEIVAKSENPSHSYDEDTEQLSPFYSHMQDSICRAKSQGSVIALVGPNFSGRTEALRALAGLPNRLVENQENASRESNSAYVSTEVYSSISGLTSTVEEEIDLHCDGPPDSSVQELARVLGLIDLFDRNPLTLSGGEQASVAVVAALFRAPQVIAIDCSLEQLDMNLKTKLLDWLGMNAPTKFAAVIADNRFDELSPENRRRCAQIATQEIGEPQNADTPTHAAERTAFHIPSYRLSCDPCDISLENVSFRYDADKLLLEDISIDLQRGQSYLLEGINGSGKSTLAKLLCGALRQTSGTIRRDGANLNAWLNPGATVSYHFQNPDVQLFETTALRELAIGAQSHGMGKSDAVDFSEELLRGFGLSKSRSRHPLELPYVLRKRLAICATLASGCPWVVLDEPTLGQDRRFCDFLSEVIKSLVLNNVGVIVITHSTDFRRNIDPSHRIRIDQGVAILK